MSYQEPGRRRLQFFAFAVAAAFGVLALTSWWQSRDNPREGSRVVSRGGPALRIAKVPLRYSGVFRVDDRAGKNVVTTTERVWVHRPFQSRIEVHTGPPPGQRRLSVRQSAFGVLTSRSRNAEPLNIAAPPSLASGDLRIDVALAAAVEDRTILRRERREVFGRDCQVYRAGGPVFAGDLDKYTPPGNEYADFCIDRNGIVVEEVWYLKEELIRRRVAVEVDIDPSIERKVFDIDVPENPGAFRGRVERIGSAGAGEGLWVLPKAPKGFEALGRYGVVISSAAVPNPGGQQPGPGPSSTTDVYVRGPDLLVVDQDPSLVRLVQQESRAQRSVRLPNLRDAKLIIDARMSEVRGVSRDGSVVRIFGTLPPSELLDLARELEPRE